MYTLRVSRRGEAFQNKCGYYPLAGKSHGFSLLQIYTQEKLTGMGPD